MVASDQSDLGTLGYNTKSRSEGSLHGLQYFAFAGTRYLLQYINSMINVIFKLSVKLHFMSEKNLRSGVIAYPENRKFDTH